MITNAFAALIVALGTQLGIDDNTNYLAFPGFPIHMAQHGLVFNGTELAGASGMDKTRAALEASNNEETFCVLVNKIPSSSPRFNFEGESMVWSVYGRVVNTARTPLKSKTPIDADFVKARTDFTLASRESPTIGQYLATSCLPPSNVSDSSAWMPITLTEDKIRQLSAQCSSRIQSWLADQRLLEGSTVKITRLSVDVFPIRLKRSWLNVHLLRSRAWNWEEGLLSDGATPPKGLMPAYISGVVLARNLRLVLDITQKDSATGGTGSIQPMLVPGKLMGTSPAIFVKKPVPLRDVVGKAGVDSQGKRTLKLGVDVDKFSAPFPVQPSYDCRDIIKHVSANLQKANEIRSTMKRAQSTLNSRISQLEENLRRQEPNLKLFANKGPNDVVETRELVGNHFLIRKEKKVDFLKRLEKTQQELASFRGEAGKVTIELQQIEDSSKELSSDLKHFQQLSNEKPDPNGFYILGFICNTLPKTPDPDPALF